MFAVAALVLSATGPAAAGAYDLFQLVAPGRLFAVDPDLAVRAVDPRSPDRVWTMGRTWGIPPLISHTEVGPFYRRSDFFFPFGFKEENLFRSKLRFTPFFESRWSKLPPFEGHSRCLTFFRGRSDLGDDYWGVFPLYGHTYRRFGVDRNFFLLFPLYYESLDEGTLTIRLLWPIVTYARGPSRSSVKVWPLFGRDAIRQDYFNTFALWPFFQKVDKYPGTPERSSYLAFPFPLFMKEETAFASNTNILWPLISIYHHYSTGHTRYKLRPLFTYGTGGGIEEVSILSLYSYKEDNRKGTKTGTGYPFVSVSGDEVFTEKKFLFMGRIQKVFRKGLLVATNYRFWPFAEYSWDLNKGSHLRMPEIIPLKSDWWDLNLGRLLRFVDVRDTPIARELSFLFGLSGYTEVKRVPHIQPPPKHEKEGWSELVMGSFGKQ